MSPKSIILSLCFFSILSFSFQIPTKPIKWVINRSCSLKVAGSTNINKFNCEIANYYKPDTLTIFKLANSEAVKLSGKMELDISDFDCHNPVMTADLRKTLKAKTFPHLTINFLSLDKYPDFKLKNGEITGKVNIELAGVTKTFEVNYKYSTTGVNALLLVGTRRVNFSDFKITPPRKLGGMIETNNELDIAFNLQLKVLN
jgi:hypothetical protein